MPGRWRGHAHAGTGPSPRASAGSANTVASRYLSRAARGSGRICTRNGSRATVLLDTDVLVYRHDPRDRAKQNAALKLFRSLAEAERAATSAQCLAEFYRVVTRRLPEPISPREALAEVARYAEIVTVLDVTAVAVLEACRGSAEHGLSVWDALVWACAKLEQIPFLLTEDGEHGRAIEGVTYLDPFDRRFDLEGLLA